MLRLSWEVFRPSIGLRGSQVHHQNRGPSGARDSKTCMITVGWRSTADLLLANSSAAKLRKKKRKKEKKEISIGAHWRLSVSGKAALGRRLQRANKENTGLGSTHDFNISLVSAVFPSRPDSSQQPGFFPLLFARADSGTRFSKQADDHFAPRPLDPPFSTHQLGLGCSLSRPNLRLLLKPCLSVCMLPFENHRQCSASTASA